MTEWDPEEADPVTVTVNELTTEPLQDSVAISDVPKVTVPGVIVQDRPCGELATVRTTGLVKPSLLASVIVELDDWPGIANNTVGVAVITKSTTAMLCAIVRLFADGAEESVISRTMINVPDFA